MDPHHERVSFATSQGTEPVFLTQAIFEITIGKGRIRHTTTLKLNDEFLDRLKID